MAADTFKGGILPGIVGSLVPLAVGFVLMVLTGAWTALMNAADVDYVDKQDGTLKEQFDQRFDDHEKIHALSEKYLERIMDNWDIQYDDLKDELERDERQAAQHD